MRIAVICVHGCPCIQPGSTDAGGMNVYVGETSERLSAMGNDVCVYTRWHPGYEARNTDDSSHLVHLEVGEIVMSKSEMPRILPDFAQALDEHARSQADRFELIASHYWLSGVVGCELSDLWSVPHATSFHTLASRKVIARSEEEEPEIRFESEARIARDADRVVVWTPEESAFIRQQFGTDDQRTVVVPPGVDTEFFGFQQKSTKTGERKRILYVGRLDALKGVDVLLEAFDEVLRRGIDAELKIVGGGSDEEFRRVLGRISELRLCQRVNVLGVVDQSALPQIYAKADCIVAPSYHETFGLAVLEAASCGTPAIASNVDGLRSIVVDGETGFLIRERNADRYAEKIIELLADETRLEDMSRACRARAVSMSWQNSVKRLQRVYNILSTPTLT